MAHTGEEGNAIWLELPTTLEATSLGPGQIQGDFASKTNSGDRGSGRKSPALAPLEGGDVAVAAEEKEEC